MSLSIQYYDQATLQANKLPKEKKSTATDDVCFLCKDGGDLIECDDSKCRKVYHSYCLSYFVEDDGRDWRCPRHFCDYCGSVNLKYVCKFCPMSICKNCPTAMVKKVSYSPLLYTALHAIPHFILPCTALPYCILFHV